jgi:hypothetical protein
MVCRISMGKEDAQRPARLNMAKSLTPEGPAVGIFQGLLLKVQP